MMRWSQVAVLCLLCVTSCLIAVTSPHTTQPQPPRLQDELGLELEFSVREITPPIRLDISDKNVTTIGDEELPHNVSSLVSKGNPLKWIDDHAFNESQTTLLALDIEQHLMASFPTRSMTNLTAMTSLTINHGPMTSIPADQSAILPHLQYLDLSYNKLTDLTNISIFTHSNKLFQVELGHNAITDVGPLYDLQLTLRLNLVNNHISSFPQPASVSSQLPSSLPAKLLYLWLSGNHLCDIPDVSFMKQLQVLDMSYNNISNSGHEKLPSSLLLLYINHNNLRWIPRAVSALTELRQLELRNNRVSSLDTFVFPASLRTINMENNTLHQLNKLNFDSNNTQLTSLALSGNPLTAIASTALSHLPRLRTLYLARTLLTRLPLALLRLTHLTSLDMSNTTHLTCTCEESALSPWSNHVTSLKGECEGGASIKYFLQTLAKQCPPPTPHS